MIILENVEEFQTWGPVRKGKPVKSKQGQTFERWKSQLAALGYEIEHRELRACDYGAPTIRKRFFLVAIASGSWLIAMSTGRPVASSIPQEAPPPPAKLSIINSSRKFSCLIIFQPFF